MRVSAANEQYRPPSGCLRLNLFGRDDHYAVEIRIGRLHFTAWRRFHPALCLTMARPGKVEAGHKEEWALWCLWQDRAWGRFNWWHW